MEGLYRNSRTLLEVTVPSLTPYGLPFLEIGGLQLSYPLLSEEQVKFCTNIDTVDRNKSP